MKKAVFAGLFLTALLSVSGCGRYREHQIKITVPKSTPDSFIYQEDFVYSEEEFSSGSSQITLSSGAGLPDTEIALKPVEVKEENAYEPVYLTPGMPVKMDVEKGAWFKIGAAVPNKTGKDLTVCIRIKNVDVRTK